MWVMHPDGGFYSAVEDKADPNQLVIRARVRADLQRLKPYLPHDFKLKIAANEGTDYPYRIRMTRQQWADVLAIFARKIDYTNFKDAVYARQGAERAHAYSRIWGVLLNLEHNYRRRWQHSLLPSLHRRD